MSVYLKNYMIKSFIYQSKEIIIVIILCLISVFFHQTSTFDSSLTDYLPIIYFFILSFTRSKKYYFRNLADYRSTESFLIPLSKNEYLVYELYNVFLSYLCLFLVLISSFYTCYYYSLKQGELQIYVLLITPTLFLSFTTLLSKHSGISFKKEKISHYFTPIIRFFLKLFLFIVFVILGDILGSSYYKMKGHLVVSNYERFSISITFVFIFISFLIFLKFYFSEKYYFHEHKVFKDRNFKRGDFAFIAFVCAIVATMFIRYDPISYVRSPSSIKEIHGKVKQ